MEAQLIFGSVLIMCWYIFEYDEDTSIQKLWKFE